MHWRFGRLYWVPGVHPASAMLEAEGVRIARSLGWRTREEVTSRAFCVGYAGRRRAVFREAGWTFYVEPASVTSGDYRTGAPLSSRFGRAYGAHFDYDTPDVSYFEAGRQGGYAIVEDDYRNVRGRIPGLPDDLGGNPALEAVLWESACVRLPELVFDGAREAAQTSDDPFEALVFDVEPTAECFEVEEARHGA